MMNCERCGEEIEGKPCKLDDIDVCSDCYEHIVFKSR